MNARHRCEVSFIARIIYLLVLGGVKTKDPEQHQELERVAYDAMMDPLKGLTEREASTIKRRVIRMESETIKKFTDNTNGVKIVLIAYYFINALVDEGYLELPEESSLAMVTDFLLSVVDMKSIGMDKQLDSAKKVAGKWLVHLRNEGYYQ